MASFNSNKDYFSYKEGDIAVFLYDLRLDSYTYAWSGQKVEVVSSGVSEATGFPELRVRFNNSRREFFADQRFFVPLDIYQNIAKTIVLNLSRLNIEHLVP